MELNVVMPGIKDIVLLSDVHLGVHNAGIEWVENAVDYFDNFFIPYISSFKEEPIVVIAGDFFDNRQVIDINVLNVGMDIVEKLTKHSVVYMLIGNHDIYKERDINVNSLRMMGLMNKVHVIDKPLCLDLGKNSRVCLMPWMITHKAETDFLTEHKDDADVFIMHSAIRGMKMDNGRPITDGLDPKCLGKKGVIYSGHIHTRQTSKNVTYIGSPFHTKRVDIGNEKGIYTLHAGNNGIKESFLPNNYSPRLVKINIEDIFELPYGDVIPMMKNNYVDLVIPKKYKKEADRMNILDAFTDSGLRKISMVIQKEQAVLKNEEGEKEKGKAGGDTTIRGIFTSKVKEMDLDQKSVDSLNTMNERYITQAVESLNYQDNGEI